MEPMNIDGSTKEGGVAVLRGTRYVREFEKHDDAWGHSKDNLSYSCSSKGDMESALKVE
jgi:hypothetical protein